MIHMSNSVSKHSRRLSGPRPRPRQTSKTFSSLEGRVSNNDVITNGNVRTFSKPHFTRPVISGSDAEESSHSDVESTSYHHYVKRISRVRKLRHVIGFRKLNRCLNSAEQIVWLCSSIETLLECQLTGVDMTVDQIEEVLRKLQQTQTNLYHLLDRITESTSLAREIEFMKANLERCVRDSLYAVDVHRKQGGEDGLLDNDWNDNEWNDHNEFQQLVSMLTNALAQPWNDSTSQDSTFSRQKVEHSLQRARQKLEEMSQKPTVALLADASFDLEELQSSVQELQLIENTMSQTVTHHNVVTEVLLFLCYQIRVTNKYLMNRADVLAMELSQQPRYSALVNEKELLLELITNARSFDKQKKVEDRTSREHAREFTQLPGNCSMQKPVWAQSWLDSSPMLLRTSRSRP